MEDPVERDARRQAGVQGPLTAGQGFEGDPYVVVPGFLIPGEGAGVAANIRQMRRQPGKKTLDPSRCGVFENETTAKLDRSLSHLNAFRMKLVPPGAKFCNPMPKLREPDTENGVDLWQTLIRPKGAGVALYRRRGHDRTRTHG